jgi:phage/plasmid primase-like uncharacterized protein
MSPDDMIARAHNAPIEAEIQRRGIMLRGRRERVGPCPRCGGRDRFSINTIKQCWNCRGCKPASIAGDVIGLVMWLDGLDFLAAVELLAVDRPRLSREASPAGVAARDDAARVASALRWWDVSDPIEGTLGQVYLERERGITELPPDAYGVLRFHCRCVFGADDRGEPVFRPCVLALLRDVVTDDPTGVHRVALTDSGKLIGRMALGRKKGAAVKLWGDAEVTTGLVVGEGLETVLAAATQITHCGTLLRPAWAMVDAENLEKLPVLASVEFLTLLADHDRAKMFGGKLVQRGQTAARSCAKRWAAAGKDCEVLIPDELGDDFNDLAKERGAARHE